MLDTSKDHVIYIGPSLPGNILRQYDTYTEGIPPHLHPVIKKCPSVGALFIHVNDLPGHEARLRDQGSVMHQVHRAVVQWTKTSLKKSK